MVEEKVEEFGRLLMEKVRDPAIKGCDVNLLPLAAGPIAQRWRSAGVDLRSVIPDCVDEAVFRLLLAIDDGLLKISFKTKNGDIVDLEDIGQGELAGWFMMTNGWREKYCRERFNDDLSDLI